MWKKSNPPWARAAAYQLPATARKHAAAATKAPGRRTLQAGRRQSSSNSTRATSAAPARPFASVAAPASAAMPSSAPLRPARNQRSPSSRAAVRKHANVASVRAVVAHFAHSGAVPRATAAIVPAAVPHAAVPAAYTSATVAAPATIEGSRTASSLTPPVMLANATAIQ